MLVKVIFLLVILLGGHNALAELVGENSVITRLDIDLEVGQEDDQFPIPEQELVGWVGEGTITETQIEHIDDDAVTVIADWLNGSSFGFFVLNIGAVAIDSNLYLSQTPSRQAERAMGVSYSIHTIGDIPVYSGIAVSTLDSSADEVNGGWFELLEGEWTDIELIVAYQPEITGFYKLVLQSVTLSEVPFSTAELNQITLSVSGDGFDTDYIHLSGNPTLAPVPIPAGMWLMLGALVPLFQKRKMYRD